ncbi:mannose-6-phosphate isomerase [Trichomonascus vanleenenianus]|uniref:mannose-6-phosphate isomerase PMI40 n=1 Tax=Trichomonascus vanleenenianus TaxID=2268995 RepID=UPI003ECB3630
MSNKVFPLICGVQSYDWGKLGKASSVAQFAAQADPSFSIDENKPYAELWMGTHPSVPSKNKTTGQSLREIVADKPELLDDSVAAKFGGGELPYLFKVLSIRKALSIQAHPDKTLGAILHKSDPKNYPDANHKPEMAIAVTEFEGFCGFRPLEQIIEFLNTVPELVELVTVKEAESFKVAVTGQEHALEGTDEDKRNRKALQALFGKLMNSDAAKVEDAAKRLVERAREEQLTFGGSAGGPELAQLIIRLNEQFPNDIGLFCGGLLLNYVRLVPGEAMFLRAKDPHAYISGDIIECMAASDNVVRAGFTPKFKDVKNLVDMLTYSYAPVMEQKMQPQPFERASGDKAHFTLYDPPIAEFAVLESKVQKGSTATIKPIAGPSILVCTEGAGKISGDEETQDFSTGSVFFVGAGVEISLEATKGTFTTYRAYCEA